MKLKFVMTEYQNEKGNSRTGTEIFEDDGGRENQVINLYPMRTDQSLCGFGGAITESAAYVYAQMSPAQKKALISSYFSEDEMRYRIVRLSLDSCDFTLSHYEADPDESDESFSAFSFERIEKFVLPMLRDAQEEAGTPLHILLSPWSPPAYMKTNGERNNGGKLKEEYRERWAEYICKYIEELEKRDFHVEMLTLQNEPKATQTWDSCVYSSQEERNFLTDYMKPALLRHGLNYVKVLIWDHNKERALERADAFFKDGEALADGVACHWYSGDHFEALRLIHASYPKARLVLSEACTELGRTADEQIRQAQSYAHEIIGDLNAGVDAFVDWNILLDESGGPFHDRRSGCAAPFIYNKQQKKLCALSLQTYLWHFSHFIEPGARRIGLSRYTRDIEATAFIKDEKIAIVLLNQTEHTLPAYIRLQNQCVRIDLPAHSILSGTID